MDTLGLRDLLAAKLGLDADCVGPEFFQLLLRRISAEKGTSDLVAFFAAAAAGGRAWQLLVDHAVVSETWFFRDETPFDHVVNIVQARLRDHISVPVRILSSPCSTGEEAYSLAIALSEAGIPRHAVEIDAADVSASAIRAAEAGIFRPRSFRGRKLFDRNHYFDQSHNKLVWHIKTVFRDMVAFRLANMVSLGGFEDTEPYDIVLCRNLLIYMHAAARSQVMSNLSQLLKSDGVLFVGHAEAAIAREHGFSGDATPSSFAFIKSNAGKPRNAPPVPISQPHSWEGRTRRSERKAVFLGSTPVPPAPGASSGSRALPTLEQIRQFGDQGQLKEALKACHHYLKQVPESAEGHFLLGVIYNSAGNVRAAETALRKALYIEPQNALALLHLALVYDAEGDAERAAMLRKRAKADPGTASRQ